MTLRQLARLWFALDGRVSRRAYAWSGLGLMACKYALDAGAIRLATGATWTPLDYLSPFYQTRAHKLASAPTWFLLVLALWTLPFVWIGASMSMRRALDAGQSPWLGLFFFSPLLNYLCMLGLALAPSRPPRPSSTWATETVVDPPLRAALVSVALSTLVAAGLLFFSVYLANRYGATLFLGVPFLLGALSGFLYNRRQERGFWATLGVALLSLGIAAALLLLFALEGVVCVAMALGIALPLALAGAAFGRAIALTRRGKPGEVALLAVGIPLLTLLERSSAPEFEVVSALEIDAPPELVWPHVIGFSELPPPEHWIFRTGIAYPLRAEIEGQGVGALRRCEFSTGAFLEPITGWEPPLRLAFDVQEQPEPLEEWSFYRRIHPPHLTTSFRTRRGEFRLVALPDGRTRLEGSTWYELELAPLAYWRLPADWIVHRIHERVLEHIRALSEASGR